MSDPARFGPYRIVSELDAGVATCVSRARHETFGREVVLKHLREAVSPSSTFAHALEREAHILADLSHPHVVALYDFIKTPDSVAMVIESVDGFRLDAVRDGAGGKLLEHEVAAVGIAIASALAHVHARGVVHRDVKPGNILVGKRGEVKLLDFGAAAKADAVDTRAATNDGELAFGTPAYLAPEQLLGAEPDPKSDVFSLAVVLFELLSGKKPFDGPSSRAKIPAVADRAPEVSRAIAAIVDGCLSPLPADRLTAEELARALAPHAPEGPSERAIVSMLARAKLVPGTPIAASSTKSARDVAPRFSSQQVLAAGVALAAVGIALGVGIAVGRAVKREPRVAAAPGETGELRVLAQPWAEVWVDGKQVETTPFARPLVLTAGSHRVTLRHPDAPDENRDVAIRAIEPVLLDVTMAVRELTAADTGGGRRD